MDTYSELSGRLPNRITYRILDWIPRFGTIPEVYLIKEVLLRLVRFTSWLILSLMLVHGTGMSNVLHKLTHHDTSASHSLDAKLAGCFHDSDTSSSDQHSDTPADPTDQPSEEDCSICLGLSGLQLLPVAQTVPAVSIPATPFYPSIAPIAAYCTQQAGDHPARAPPIC